MSEKRNPVGAFIEEKLVPLSTGFAQNPYIRCIGSGSQRLMAIIMLGAIFIAIFKNKANSRRNGTSLSSQKAKLSEKHIVSRSEEHPGSVP